MDCEDCEKCERLGGPDRWSPGLANLQKPEHVMFGFRYYVKVRDAVKERRMDNCERCPLREAVEAAQHGVGATLFELVAMAERFAITMRAATRQHASLAEAVRVLPESA